MKKTQRNINGKMFLEYDDGTLIDTNPLPERPQFATPHQALVAQVVSNARDEDLRTKIKEYETDLDNRARINEAENTTV